MKYIKTSIYSILLLLLFSTSSFADCNYQLFSISSTKNTKIIDFINQLSDECGFSIIVTDPHAEKFLKTKLNKTNLKNLTINEVLEIILTENNLSYTLKNNLLKISYLTTRVFSIDYILSQRKSTGSTDVTLSSNSSSNTQSQSGSMSNGGSSSSVSGSNSQGNGGAQTGIKIESTDEVKFWATLDKEFQSVLNRPEDTYKASKPIINRNAGLITITATAKQMKRFESYLKKLQKKVQLQVLIDVQILSVRMKKGKTTGIDWSQLYALQNIDVSLNHTESSGSQATTATAAVANTINGVTNLVNIKATGSLKEVVKFLKTQGDVSSISNPKVLTLNNQPALITAGTEYFYKTTSTETLSGGSGAGTQSANENVQSVFAGVLLTITPEISDNNAITLKINPSLSQTSNDISGSDNSHRTMPPDLDRRQLSSVVTVKDGHRIILGGLINTRNTLESNKVPILGDIPLISPLFSYEQKVKDVEELVLIIQPHIIHKKMNNVSLADLGYTKMKNSIIMKDTATDSKKITKTKKVSSNTPILNDSSK